MDFPVASLTVAGLVCSFLRW